MWNRITLWILLAFVPPLFTQSKFDPTPLPEPLLWGEPAHGACLDLLGTQAFFRCQATLKAMSSPKNPWFYEQHICPLQVNARHQIPVFFRTAWIRASCQMSEYPTSLSLDLSHMDPDVSLEVEEGWQQPSFQGSASEGTWGPAGSTAPQGTALWVSIWAVIMPFGAEMENLDEFPPCSEPTRIYIGQKWSIYKESCLGTQKLPGYIFGKFDVSLICSCLETAICRRYIVTAFSKLARRSVFMRTQHIWNWNLTKTAQRYDFPRNA